MKGTITEATRAMRLMPPRITTATTAAMPHPKSRRRVCSLSSPVNPPSEPRNPLPDIPSGVEKLVMKASVSWLAFIMHRVPNMPAMAKNLAMGVQRFPRPCSIMCMGPPCGLPLSSRPLYMIASTPSWYLVAMPTSALTHIQNIAPGPPITRAMATPAILPRPTVAATTPASACTDDIWPPPLCSGLRRSSARAAGSLRRLTAPERRNR